jgi:hypothetical protein
MFDGKRRAKPLRIILGVLANPFTRPLSEGLTSVSVPCGKIQMSVLRGGGSLLTVCVCKWWLWLDRKKRS